MPDRLPDIGVNPTVPGLLRAAVDSFGDDDYVVMTNRRLSFREADRRSALVARRLLAAGIGKGARIGIVLPSSIEFAVAFLAVARIGALAALFSTTYRPAELRRAMRIADVQILIAPSGLLGRDYLDQLEATVEGLAPARPPYRLPSMPFLREIWVDGVSDRAWATPISLDPTESDPPAAPGVDGELLAAVESEVTPADALLVIWTSGSSADPKGVVHTHGVAVRKVAPEVGLGLAPSSPGRVFVAMPFFWVGGPQSLLGALFSGAALVCQERFEAGAAMDLIERERCTVIAGWALTIETLRKHPDWDSHDMSSMSDTSPRSSRLGSSSRGDPINLGMTETFGPHFDPGLFDYKVVDPLNGGSLSEGEEGEFCVRGFGLMAAMYKREREDVLDDDGYYRTGDRGYLEGGRIFFTGRYSEMIKSNGANVAPLEVEASLLGFPEVRQAFVVGVASRQRGEDVVAVIVAESDVELDPAEIRRRLGNVLSAYKVPRRIDVVAEADVPTLATGKVDKRSMRANLEAKLSN